MSKHVVFDELSDDNLLMKCLQGKTQKQNEAFNGIIWNRIPKSRFVGYKQFEMDVLDGVVHFNIGNLATVLIFDQMGMERGFCTMNGCLNENTRRITNANRKDTKSVKN